MFRARYTQFRVQNYDFFVNGQKFLQLFFQNFFNFFLSCILLILLLLISLWISVVAIPFIYYSFQNQCTADGLHGGIRLRW